MVGEREGKKEYKWREGRKVGGRYRKGKEKEGEVES